MRGKRMARKGRREEMAAGAGWLLAAGWLLLAACCSCQAARGRGELDPTPARPRRRRAKRGAPGWEAVPARAEPDPRANTRPRRSPRALAPSRSRPAAAPAAPTRRPGPYALSYYAITLFHHHSTAAACPLRQSPQGLPPPSSPPARGHATCSCDLWPLAHGCPCRRSVSRRPWPHPHRRPAPWRPCPPALDHPTQPPSRPAAPPPCRTAG